MEGWTHESRMDSLIAERDQLKVELGVINGTVCAEEQAAGNGPCGICRTCCQRRIGEAMSLIEKLARRKCSSEECKVLSEEAFQFIMKGPTDTKYELEREIIRVAKSWADDCFDDDRALVRAVNALITEEQRRQS